MCTHSHTHKQCATCVVDSAIFTFPTKPMKQFTTALTHTVTQTHCSFGLTNYNEGRILGSEAAYERKSNDIIPLLCPIVKQQRTPGRR